MAGRVEVWYGSQMTIWRYALSGLIFGLCYIAAGLLIGDEGSVGAKVWRAAQRGEVDLIFVLPLVGVMTVAALIGWREKRRGRREAARFLSADPRRPRNH